MAHSVLEARSSFERLDISRSTGGERNLTIQTPDNVTLVLNFGGLGKELSIRSPVSLPPAMRSTGTDSAGSPGDYSPTDDLSSQSPSESPSSSTPSSPELSRSSTQTDLAAAKPSTSSSTKNKKPKEPRRQPSAKLPTRETLDKFLNQQVQMHGTSSEDTYSDVYSENYIRKKHYLSFTKHHRIRDAKFDADCNILLASRHSVQLYDANGHFIERLYRDKVEEPWGLHVHDNGSVFVSDHKNDCVKEFNSIGIQLKKYGPVPSPCGVAVSSSNFVFVCSKDDACIYVFDKNNKLVTKIGEGILSKPAFIVLHEKLVLVSDEARIIGFTTDNSIAFVYGHADKTNHPASLSIDKKTGFALATAYYKSSVIAVKKGMTRAITTKEATRPILVAVSPYGHLLIGERLAKGVQFKMYRGD